MNNDERLSSTVTQCPNDEVLQEFALGRATDADFEQLALHIELCDACNERLEKLDGRQEGLSRELRGLPDVEVCVDSSDGFMAELASSVLLTLDKELGGRLTFDAGQHYSRQLADGPCQLGRFELVEELGVGSFGHVFRAFDSELNRTVAVKVQRAGRFTSEDEAKRFLREARGTASLIHPAIVSLYESGRTEDGVCFLVTEYVSGGTLEDRIGQGKMSQREAASLAMQIAEALEYAHQHGVVHRDVKPSNILVDESDAPHVTDFGLAKLESTDGTMTSDDRVMGTPAYMSPEHARGASHQADARTDVYSLGVILYEMLTQQRPFQGARRLLLLQILEDEPKPPRQLDGSIPRDLETICLKAMSKLPQRRYQAAKALACDLQRFLDGEAIQARPVGNFERLLRWCRKYPFAAALFVGVTVAAIVGFSYLRHLNAYFVQEMSLDTARQYSNMLDEFNATYSDVRGEFFGHGKDTGTVPPPLPATLQIELAERISRHEDGMQVRIFSPYSFRMELRPSGEFELQTLKMLETRLHDRASLERYEFASIDGRAFLKYARGQLMTASCIECHNTHKESPKTDWKEGDLAGVLTLTKPLDRDIRRTQIGFRGASLLMLAIVGILTVVGLVFAWRTGNRHWEPTS